MCDYFWPHFFVESWGHFLKYFSFHLSFILKLRPSQGFRIKNRKHPSKSPWRSTTTYTSYLWYLCFWSTRNFYWVFCVEYFLGWHSPLGPLLKSFQVYRWTFRAFSCLYALLKLFCKHWSNFISKVKTKISHRTRKFWLIHFQKIISFAGLFQEIFIYNSVLNL